MTHAQPGSHDFYCADCSRDASEQAFGSAVAMQVCLALEFREPWPRRATEQAALPQAVRERLLAGVVGYSTRPLLIRQAGRLGPRTVLFVAVTDEQKPRLYRFALDRVEDLLTLDLPGVVAGLPQFESQRVEAPLLLVCTNGKHDRSCAHYGVALEHALAAQNREAVWQSTHLGGHRFAGTALILPEGVMYGRLLAQDAPALLAASGQRRIMDLAHLRGRVCYPKHVQAAEYYLRRATGELALPGYRLLETVEAGIREWIVRFAALADGAVYAIRLAADQAVDVYMNSTDAAPESSPQYRLMALEAERAG